MARGRRSQKAPPPQPLLKKTDPVPDYPKGLARGSMGEIIRRAATGANVVEADEISLASHLVRDLDAFIRHGRKDLRLTTIVEPVLKKYLEGELSRRWERLSFDLMRTSWMLAKGQLTAKRALKWAKGLRYEATWNTDNGDAIKVAALREAAADGKRGPKTTTRRKAARVYRLLAWDSRASVQPTEGEKDDDVSLLLDAQERYEQLLAEAENSR